MHSACSRHGAVLVLSLLLAPGCARNRYELEIRPQGAEFDRKLTAWAESKRAEAPLFEDDVERIKKVYPEYALAEDQTRSVFSGRFKTQTPGDFGGAGSYIHLSTPLGSATSYMERFRGELDLTAARQKQCDAIDRLIELAVGWLKTELPNEEASEKLYVFLDRDLRQDLKNLSLLNFVSDLKQTLPDSESAVPGTATKMPAAPTPSNEEFLMRASQYLMERGYFSPGDIPSLTRIFVFNRPDLQRNFEGFLRRLARKSGVGQGDSYPDSWKALFDEQRLEQLQASANAYLRKTPEYQRIVAEWEEKRKADPKLEQPKPKEVLDVLMRAAFEFGLFAQIDALTVRVYTPDPPISTNGRWDPKAGCVVFVRDLRAGARWPAFCYVTWSSPAREFQQAHFGRLALTGDPLSQYVGWYHALTSAEAREWDAFVESLTGDAASEKRLATFRFSTDPPPDSNQRASEQPSLADTARGLLAKDGNR